MGDVSLRRFPLPILGAETAQSKRLCSEAQRSVHSKSARVENHLNCFHIHTQEKSLSKQHNASLPCEIFCSSIRSTLIHSVLGASLVSLLIPVSRREGKKGILSK